MGVRSFYDALYDHGRVRIKDAAPPSAQDLEDAETFLLTVECELRLDLAGQAPSALPDVVRWSLLAFYRACQFFVFRDASPRDVQTELAKRCPQPPSPQTHYSADLAFRFLPDLVRLTRAASPDDPLTAAVIQLAGNWPLSSVGLAGLEGIEIGSFFDDPCLRQLYLDRILERRDLSRLGDGRVRGGLRQSLGLFSELAPEICRELELDSPSAETLA